MLVRSDNNECKNNLTENATITVHRLPEQPCRQKTLDMRGSRKFCQRGSNVVVRFCLFGFVVVVVVVVVFMARCKWYLDPLSFANLKKQCLSWTPMTKLPGSAHDFNNNQKQIQQHYKKPATGSGRGS